MTQLLWVLLLLTSGKHFHLELISSMESSNLTVVPIELDLPWYPPPDLGGRCDRNDFELDSWAVEHTNS